MGLFEKHVSETVGLSRKKSSWLFYVNLVVIVMVVAIIAVSIMIIAYPNIIHWIHASIIIIFALGTLSISISILKATKEMKKDLAELYKVSIGRRLLENLSFNEMKNFSIQEFEKVISSSIPTLSNQNLKNSSDNNELFSQKIKKSVVYSKYDPGEILFIKDFGKEKIDKESLIRTCKIISEKIKKEHEKIILYIFICGESFDDKLELDVTNIQLLDREESLVFYLKKDESGIHLF